MSARQRTVTRRISKKRFSFKALRYIVLVSVLVSLFFYIKATRTFWNGEDKISIAVGNENGDVDIVIFDPEISEIITISIPGTTEVEVAQGLGVWKLKSVWELGIKEGYGGSLLTRTITKHFKFPLYVWAEKEAAGFFRGSLPENFKASFLPYSTNLGVGDKLSIGIFSLRVKNPKRVDIDLVKTGYLRKKTLADGEAGYSVTGVVPQNLSILFSDRLISENVYRIRIRDGSGKVGLAQEIGEIIEVLGGKVSSIEKAEERNTTCEVRGKNQSVTKKVSLLLPCTVVSEPPEGNFDLEFSLGTEFTNVY